MTSSSPSISRKFDLRLNLRHAGRLFGVRQIVGNPQLDGRGELTPANGALQLEEHQIISGVGSRSISTENNDEFVPNRDRWKVRIIDYRRSAWQRFKKRWGNIKALFLQLLNSDLPLQARIDVLRSGRQLTPQEISEIRDEQEERRLDEFHRSQAELGRRRIINTLDRLKHCSWTETNGRRYIKESVHISYIEYNSLYYSYYVDGGSLPWGVSIMDIQGDNVCTDLSAACQHPVRDEIKRVANAVIGLRYMIEIAATMGVPNLCKFSALLPLLPKSAPPLAFITGYSEGKRLRYADLEDMPHFLGGGQTKGGKSNMMHVIICTLISRNSPDDLRLIMIDLKFNGIEMARYKGIPHLVAMHDLAKPGDFIPEVLSGIATVPEQAVTVLRWVVKESHRRGNMMTRDGIQNLRQWNHKHPTRKMPYIVIINDELAQLRLDKRYGGESYDLLQEILSTARAAGISFITFTQSSNSRVIDEFIKINLPGRICFSVPDASSSILFVGNGAALGLTPAGRAIYRYGTEKYLVQTPLIEPSDIAEVVRNAREGKLTTHLVSQPLLPEEIIEWAVEHNQSSLAYRDVFQKFGKDLQRIDEIGVKQLLQEMEGHDYRVGDHVYQILPGVGNRPRALIQLDKPQIEGPDRPFSQPTAQLTEDQPQRCAYCRTLNEPDGVECTGCGAPL